jgi:hypothetical protein
MKSSQRTREWPAAAQNLRPRNSWIYYRSVLNSERYTRSPVNNSAVRPSWRSPINVETAVVRYGHAADDKQNLLQVRRGEIEAVMCASRAARSRVNDRNRRHGGGGDGESGRNPSAHLSPLSVDDDAGNKNVYVPVRTSAASRCRRRAYAGAKLAIYPINAQSSLSLQQRVRCEPDLRG